MRKNFTLLELSVVMLIIVSLASLIVSQALPIVQQTTEWNLNQKMQQIEEAIAGSSSIRDYDGSVIPNGYISDMGEFPDINEPTLTYDFQPLLYRIPDSTPSYANQDLTISGKIYAGWNGPYLTEVAYSKLKSIIQLEYLDNDGDGQDDLRIYANGYSDLERVIYWKDFFKKRNITISGVPAEFTVKVTIDYIKAGLIESFEQNVTGSDETTVDLPTGICAFYAELKVDHSVIDIVVDPPGTPLLNESYLVASSSATGVFTGKENQVATWNEISYDFTAPGDLESLYDEESGKYYLYDGSNWIEKSVQGTKTPRVIKTLKTEIELGLE